jgi:FAD/FMN-containing dehydrogenase
MKHILQIIQLAQCHLGEILAAVEWMDPNILQVIHKAMDDNDRHEDTTKPTRFHNLILSSSHTSTTMNDTKMSFSYPHCILIETHGTNPQHDEDKCYDFLSALMELNTDEKDSNESLSVDVKMAKSETDSQYFWSVRESANPSVTKLGYTYKYDVSIPNSYFHLLIQPIRDRIYEKYTIDRIIISNWGHILDGNLHLNITDIGNHERDTELVSILEPFIYEQVVRLGGSISAEHGIGQMKTKYMSQIHDPNTIQMMHSIKKYIFDPAGIMNPGKVLPLLPQPQRQ